MENILREYLIWHKQQFPNATIEQVADKCCEEVTEFIHEYNHGQSTQDYILELADVILTHAAYIDKLTDGQASLIDVLSHKLAVNRLNYIDGVRVNNDH